MKQRMSLIKASAWKMLERVSCQAAQFVIQIVLARLLLPSDYGALAIMMVFIAFSTILVQGGFNTALLQAKNVQGEDYSSMLLVSFAIAVIIFLILFLSAPAIEQYYGLNNFARPFRILVLILLPMSHNSIQIAQLQREIKFKVLFFATLTSTVISGSISIIIAYKGLGIWALVIQQLVNYVSICVLLHVFAGTKFSIKAFSFSRAKKLIRFGWKIAVVNLIDTALRQLRTLIIGKCFSSSVLGYYDRGLQFPSAINECFSSLIQSIGIPLLSKQQDDINQLKAMTRKTIRMGVYIIFPVIAGLIAVSEPLILLLLTEKWLPCLIFLRIGCMAYLCSLLDALNQQCVIALGRSDIYLAVGTVKRVIGLVVLIIAVIVFKTVQAIAISMLVGAFINNLINLLPNLFLIKYSPIEFCKDIFMPAIMSMIMGITVLLVGTLIDNLLCKIIVEVLIGIILYLGLSFIIRPEGFRFMYEATIKKLIDRQKG